MSNPSLGKPALLDPLSVILPTTEETLLLRACLYSGESARQAWKEWQSHANGHGNGSLGQNTLIKKLGPLISNTVRSEGLGLDEGGQSYLKLLYLREELRSKIVRRIFCDVLSLLGTAGVPTIVLKGAALAETVYDNPTLRHCHDIDVMVQEEDISRAASLLPALGFKALPSPTAPASNDYQLEHESGLPLVLHSRLFQIPYYNGSLREMWERSQNQVLAGARARILAPSDNLLHVCGHAFYSRSRESLRWVSDAWLLIHRHRDLDWDMLLDCAYRNHLTLPLSVTLGYLAEDLEAPIPQTFLSRLFEASERSTVTERELALFGARSSARGGIRNLFRKAPGWRGKAFVIQWMLFPSPRYLLWAHQIHPSWFLPFHYLYRPIKYVASRLGWKDIPHSGKNTSTPARSRPSPMT